MICSGSGLYAHLHLVEGILTALRKGVADEELAKKEAKRGRMRRAGECSNLHVSRKRSRSISSSSSTSVSTISTNLSRSPTPRHTSRHATRGYHGSGRHSQAVFSQDTVHKRRRSSSMSTTSYASESLVDRRCNHRSRNEGHHRHSSSSPDPRRGERDPRMMSRPRSVTRKRRRSSSSSSLSYTSVSSHEGRRREVSMNEHRNTRRRRSLISPERRGRDRGHDGRSIRRTRSRSNSMDRSQVARNRQSMTPGATSNGAKDRNRKGTGTQGHQPLKDRDRRFSNDDDRYGSSFRDGNTDDFRRNRPLSSPPPRRERSLSPFSKRLALTQAMNMGR